MPRLAVTIAAVGAAAAAVLVWGEVVHWRSSRRRLGGQPAPGPREAVVVLGYRNRTDRANLINRYRVGAGIRSQSRTSQSPASQRPTSQGVLVLSGGSVGGPIPEAEVMARYAREVLHFKGELVTETESRSTWENIRNVIPLIESADRIKIVSNSVHAEKGRLYLARLRPDLAERLVQAEDYRFGELILLKPVIALICLIDLRRAIARSGAPLPVFNSGRPRTANDLDDELVDQLRSRTASPKVRTASAPPPTVPGARPHAAPPPHRSTAAQGGWGGRLR